MFDHLYSSESEGFHIFLDPWFQYCKVTSLPFLSRPFYALLSPYKVGFLRSISSSMHVRDQLSRNPVLQGALTVLFIQLVGL